MKLADLIATNPYEKFTTEQEWIDYGKEREEILKRVRFFVSVENKRATMIVSFEHDGEDVRLWHRVWDVHWTVQPYANLPQTICEVLQAGWAGETEHISQDTLDWEKAVRTNERILELVEEIPYPLASAYGYPEGLKFYDTLEKHLLLGKPLHAYQHSEAINDHHIYLLMGLRGLNIEGFWHSIHEKYRWRDLAAQISSYEGDLPPEDREGYGVEFE